ncbi:hypothetical protein K438DRAFT_1783370 [Mycena galopus ATCC 62051]|nr:hypothetical protein K438DRAFT_1783370 [Mycena galopus ATCC 62051]
MDATDHWIRGNTLKMPSVPQIIWIMGKNTATISSGGDIRELQVAWTCLAERMDMAQKRFVRCQHEYDVQTAPPFIFERTCISKVSSEMSLRVATITSVATTDLPVPEAHVSLSMARTHSEVVIMSLHGHQVTPSFRACCTNKIPTEVHAPVDCFKSRPGEQAALQSQVCTSAPPESSTQLAAARHTVDMTEAPSIPAMDIIKSQQVQVALRHVTAAEVLAVLKDPSHILHSTPSFPSTHEQLATTGKSREAGGLGEDHEGRAGYAACSPYSARLRGNELLTSSTGFRDDLGFTGDGRSRISLDSSRLSDLVKHFEAMPLSSEHSAPAAGQLRVLMVAVCRRTVELGWIRVDRSHPSDRAALSLLDMPSQSMCTSAGDEFPAQDVLSTRLELANTEARTFHGLKDASTRFPRACLTFTNFYLKRFMVSDAALCIAWEQEGIGAQAWNYYLGVGVR